MKTPVLWLLLVIFWNIGFGQTQIQYFRDTYKEFSANSVQKIPFKDYNKTTLNFGKDSSLHWLKVKISNPEQSNILCFFEVNSPWLDSLNFISEKGKSTKTLSWATPTNERFYDHQSFILPLEIKAQSDTTFFCKFYKKAMLVNGTIEIEKAEQFFKGKILSYVLIGLFGGVTLTVAIFSLLLFFAQMEKIYLFYSLYCIFNLGYCITAQGYFLSIYQPGFGLLISGNELATWLLWLSQVSLMFFVRAFLWENFTMPKWLGWTWKVALTLMLSIVILKVVLVYFIQPRQTSIDWILKGIIFAFSSSIITCFLMTTVALHKKINPSATISYFIGMMPIFIILVLSYLRNLSLIKNLWVLGQRTQMICITFDILVLMVGIGLRYRQISAEKDKQTLLAIKNKIKLLTEKERISRDLHDSVGLKLTVISTELNNAIFQSEKHMLNSDKLNQINENVREAVQSLRDSIWATHQSDISFKSFETRLKSYISRISNDNVKFEVLLCDQQKLLNSLTALNLFRIVQEAIQNSLKHSGATQIQIISSTDFNIYQLIIADNGIGFEPNKVLTPENFGIENMKRRVAEINGKIEFDFSKGTAIKINFNV